MGMSIIYFMYFNPVLHRLFLDYDIILFLDSIEKNQEKLNTFQNIMENGAFAPKEQMLHFP